MITIQQDTLKSALNSVTRASLKNSLAALSLVRLDARSNGTLYLSCFNGETAARAIAYAACDEDMSVSVDAVTLKDVVETLVSEIHLSVDQNSLVIQSTTNRTTLRIVDEVFPMIGDESISPIATITGTTFRSIFRILPFASTDSTRASLQVLHLTLDQENILTQAADGYTAACVKEGIEGPSEQISISLPVSISRLLSTLVDEGDIMHIGTSGESRYIFHIKNTANEKDLTLATVTSAENFPSEQITNLITNARNSETAQLNVQQSSLLQSIRMVNAMDSQSAFIKTVNGATKIASAETETGQARNILEGTASGANTNIWLSTAFLKRAVEACKGELLIRIADGKNPMLIEAGSLTAIIMPLLVDGQKDPFPEDEAIAITLPEISMA